MERMLIEMQSRLWESMGMRGEINPAVGKSVEVVPEEQTLRRMSSDYGCTTLNRSVIRLQHVILVGLWN